MKPKIGFSIESLVGGNPSPPPYFHTREDSLSPINSPVRSPSPILSTGSFFNPKSFLEFTEKPCGIQRPQPINGATQRLLAPAEALPTSLPAVLQAVKSIGGGLPASNNPLIPQSHAHALPFLPPGGLQGVAAAVASAAAAQGYIPPQLNPLMMGAGGGIHSIANTLPREYPLYPWLLSRHGRVYPQGLPSPEHLAYLLQPFRKPKRIRTAFSPSQLLKLEQAFEKNPYVVGGERKQLALSLNLSETQVKVWFQNRRTKEKRISQEGETESEERTTDENTSLDETSLIDDKKPINESERMNDLAECPRAKLTDANQKEIVPISKVHCDDNRNSNPYETCPVSGTSFSTENSEFDGIAINNPTSGTL